MRNSQIILCFFLYLVLKTSVTNAQFFGMRHGNPSDFYGMTLKYPNDDKFRVVSTKLTPGPTNFGQATSVQILIYNQTLSLIDSIPIKANLYITDKTPVKMDDKILWPVLIEDSTNTGLYGAAVEELDTLYNHIYTHRVSGLKPNVWAVTELVYLGKHFFFGVCFGGPDSSIIYKLDKQFVKVDSIIFKGSKIFQLFNFRDQLLVLGSGLPSPCLDNLSGRAEKLSLDTNFILKNCFTFDYYPKVDTIEGHPFYKLLWSYYSRLFPISNTKILATGNCNFEYTTWPQPFKDAMAIVNILLDQNDSLLKSNVFVSALTNTSYVNTSYNGATNIIDRKQNEIISIGVVGMSFQKSWLQSQKSKMLVIKTDTLGNLIWKKEYGGDMYYHPRSILFTNDGGYLISGMRYDSANTDLPDIMDAFLLKIGPSGEYQSISTFWDDRTIRPLVKAIPNPAANSIYFDIPFESQVTIKIYDMLGKVLYERKNYETLTPIDISILPEAVYNYKIQTDRNSFNGKFSKVVQ